MAPDGSQASQSRPGTHLAAAELRAVKVSLEKAAPAANVACQARDLGNPIQRAPRTSGVSPGREGRRTERGTVFCPSLSDSDALFIEGCPKRTMNPEELKIISGGQTGTDRAVASRYWLPDLPERWRQTACIRIILIRMPVNTPSPESERQSFQRASLRFPSRRLRGIAKGQNS